MFNYRNVFGLQSGFSYQWTVRAWCDSAGNIVSPWAALDTFTTLLFNSNRHPEGGTTDRVPSWLREGPGWEWPQNSTRSFASAQDDVVLWGDDGLSPTLNIFPNPADEVIHLEWAGNREAEVKVWSVTGQLIHSATEATGKLRLSAGNWSNGVYVVEIKSGGSVERTRLVKH